MSCVRSWDLGAGARKRNSDWPLQRCQSGFTEGRVHRHAGSESPVLVGATWRIASSFRPGVLGLAKLAPVPRRTIGHEQNTSRILNANSLSSDRLVAVEVLLRQEPDEEEDEEEDEGDDDDDDNRDDDGYSE